MIWLGGPAKNQQSAPAGFLGPGTWVLNISGAERKWPRSVQRSRGVVTTIPLPPNICSTVSRRRYVVCPSAARPVTISTYAISPSGTSLPMRPIIRRCHKRVQYRDGVPLGAALTAQVHRIGMAARRAAGGSGVGVAAALDRGARRTAGGWRSRRGMLGGGEAVHLAGGVVCGVPLAYLAALSGYLPSPSRPVYILGTRRRRATPSKKSRLGSSIPLSPSDVRVSEMPFCVAASSRAVGRRSALAVLGRSLSML